MHSNNTPSRAEVDAAWANFTPPTPWQATCRRYLRWLDMRGAGGGLTDQDRFFLCEAAEEKKTTISKVVDALRQSSDSIEVEVGNAIFDFGIYR